MRPWIVMAAIAAGLAVPVIAGGKAARGRHGQAGDPPDLAVVARYPLDAFRTLIRTGKGLGGRKVGEMSQAAAATGGHAPRATSARSTPI